MTHQSVNGQPQPIWSTMQHGYRRELLPLAQMYYEREIGRLSRPDRKGWARANCPFHKSKSHRSFSVQLHSGAFFCHGCGAKGHDLVAFVMRRDGVTFVEAAKSLGAWARITPEEH